jgi:hypothetical protein
MAKLPLLLKTFPNEKLGEKDHFHKKGLSIFFRANWS